jgi:hypothetical protein
VRARERALGRVTLRGRTEPLAPELLLTVVDLGGADAHDVPGVLLDTLAIPEPREAWTAIAIAALLVVAAALAYALARRAPVRPQAPTQRPKSQRLPVGQPASTTHSRSPVRHTPT